jgi:hypothetical protein
LTILYRSTDRRCRRGAPVKNLAHSASLQLLDKTAPSKFGIKQLGSPRNSSAERVGDHHSYHLRLAGILKYRSV